MSHTGELDGLVLKAVKALDVGGAAATHLPARAGLYTLAPTGPEAVSVLGLEDLQPEEPLARRILYLGKAEDSLESRLISTHFAPGESGHSTVRRTLGALLGCQATPRGSRIINPSRKQLMTMT